MKFFKRLLIIALGYVLATLVAGFLVSLLLMLIPNAVMNDSGSPVSQLVQMTLLVALFTGLVTGGAVLALITLTEWKTVRHPLVYAAAGAAAGLGLGALFAMERWFLWAGLVIGTVAGLLYWRVAGRTAGALFEAVPNARRPVLIGLLLVSFIVTIMSLSAVFGVPGGSF